MTKRALVRPVILSGGAGTRLWPLSQGAMPKQFLSITGAETMLQMAAARVDDPALFSAPMLVAHADHAEAIDAQLGAIGVTPALTIFEPVARNTAPAIALAALSAAPDELLLVMPSDQIVERPEAFRARVAEATALAADGWIVTFGIVPTRPDTGFGYIRRGEALGADLYRVDSFVEKPDAARAQALVDVGDAWNAGIFLFRADIMLAALETHAPAILAAARASLAGKTPQNGQLHPDPSAFATSPSQAIDTALIEKAERVAVAPVAMGWSDLGSWDALYDLLSHDDDGNALAGPVTASDARGNLIRSDGPNVIAIGVEDLIVVATGDAVLIVPRGQSQKVRDALAKLRPKPL